MPIRLGRWADVIKEIGPPPPRHEPESVEELTEKYYKIKLASHLVQAQDDEREKKKQEELEKMAEVNREKELIRAINEAVVPPRLQHESNRSCLWHDELSCFSPRLQKSICSPQSLPDESSSHSCTARTLFNDFFDPAILDAK